MDSLLVWKLWTTPATPAKVRRLQLTQVKKEDIREIVSELKALELWHNDVAFCPPSNLAKLSKFRNSKDSDILETAANVPRRQITVVLETDNKTAEIVNPKARKRSSI